MNIKAVYCYIPKECESPRENAAKTIPASAYPEEFVVTLYHSDIDIENVTMKKIEKNSKGVVYKNSSNVSLVVPMSEGLELQVRDDKLKSRGYFSRREDSLDTEYRHVSEYFPAYSPSQECTYVWSVPFGGTLSGYPCTLMTELHMTL